MFGPLHHSFDVMDLEVVCFCADLGRYARYPPTQSLRYGTQCGRLPRQSTIWLVGCRASIYA